MENKKHRYISKGRKELILDDGYIEVMVNRKFHEHHKNHYNLRVKLIEYIKGFRNELLNLAHQEKRLKYEAKRTKHKAFIPKSNQIHNHEPESNIQNSENGKSRANW